MMIVGVSDTAPALDLVKALDVVRSRHSSDDLEALRIGFRQREEEGGFPSGCWPGSGRDGVAVSCDGKTDKGGSSLGTEKIQEFRSERDQVQLPGEQCTELLHTGVHS